MRVCFYETKDGRDPISHEGMHGQFSYEVDYDPVTGACSITESTTTSYADGRIDKTTSVYSGELTLVTPGA